MKKNIFLSILALASMFFATSCSQDELFNESTNEDFVNARFTIETADGIATRAVGDGTTVDKVACAVYDAYNNEELESLRQDVAITNKTATFSVRLAKGKNYRVAFFAYNEEANAYDVTDLKSIKVNGNQLSNVEGRDAFTAYVDVTEGETMNAFTKEVTLKRPFAQLNLGIDDAEFAEAANAGLTVAKSKIVVSNVYNAFSAFDNAVAENAVEGSMTFELNAIPTEKLKVTVNGEEKLYNYLALNYLLVGDNDSEKTLTDIKFTWESNNGDSNAESVTEFINIPVQRNYRTNIIGKLLTSPTIFNIIIDEEFEGDKNDGRIFNATDLKAALDAAPENATTVITLGANIEANVTDIQKPGRKVVIDGRGYKYNGTIKVHSNSLHYTDAALTIKNLNFETSTASVNFIEALDNGSERYSCNITVENCTFTATGAAENTAVGVQIKTSKNAKVIGCKATKMHSLIQAQSCDESVLVKDCTVNGKNGVAFKQVKNAVVEGTTITAAEYGIRFDGNTDNYGITVKDNEVTASQPFIVRKMTGKDNTIALEGENTLTVSAVSISTEAPAYQIVITNGNDDEAYVKPTGTYTLTGADNYLVYPRDYAHPVASWDEFTAALANEPKIKLIDNIEYSANYQLQKDVVIDLNGKSMTLPMINIHKNVTIKNGTINGKAYARKNSEIVFNNVKFSGAVADNLSTEGHLQVQGGCKSLYAKDCLFSPTSVSGTQTKPLSFEGGSTIMKFENCEFKSSPYKKQVYFNSLSATGSLDITNCNFNDKTPNIMFAAACPLTNLTMSGTTKLSSVTLETNRAKDAVTEVEWAHISSLIANNKFTDVRVFYADGSDEYIH